MLGLEWARLLTSNLPLILTPQHIPDVLSLYDRNPTFKLNASLVVSIHLYVCVSHNVESYIIPILLNFLINVQH